MKYQNTAIATLALILAIGTANFQVSAQVTTLANPATTATLIAVTPTKIKDEFPWWATPFLAVGGGLLWVFRKKPDKVISYAAPASFVPRAKSVKVSSPIPFPLTPRGFTPAPFPVENLSPGLRQVWLSVNHDPTSFDSIMSQSQRDPEDMNDALSALESMGLITQLPGRKYQRVSTSLN